MLVVSKKISLLLLGITAITCSRILFLCINDPEGPNLLVVLGMAAILYFLSLAVYVFLPATVSLKKLPLAILTQLLIAAGLYFCLR